MYFERAEGTPSWLARWNLKSFPQLPHFSAIAITVYLEQEWDGEEDCGHLHCLPLDTVLWSYLTMAVPNRTPNPTVHSQPPGPLPAALGSYPTWQTLREHLCNRQGTHSQGLTTDFIPETHHDRQVVSRPKCTFLCKVWPAIHLETTGGWCDSLPCLPQHRSHLMQLFLWSRFYFALSGRSVFSLFLYFLRNFCI